MDASSNHLEDLCTKEAAAMQEVQHLQHQVQELSACKSWEENLPRFVFDGPAGDGDENLLRTVFDGPAGDGRENYIEAEYNGLAPRLQEIRMYKQKYCQAFELIRSARKDLSQACQLLQSALGLATADMVMNMRRGPGRGGRGMGAGPGNMMVDIAKRAQMRDMHKIDIKKANGLKGLGLMDMM
eukprot:gene5705-17602_t